MYTFIHSNRNTWLNHSMLQELKDSEAKIVQWYSHGVAFCDVITTGMHCYYIDWLIWKIPTPSTKGCITDCLPLRIFFKITKLKNSEIMFYVYYINLLWSVFKHQLKMAIPLNLIYYLQLIIKLFSCNHCRCSNLNFSYILHPVKSTQILWIHGFGIFFRVDHNKIFWLFRNPIQSIRYTFRILSTDSHGRKSALFCSACTVLPYITK